MTADMTTVGIASIASIPSLRSEAVARVLEHASIRVLRGDAAVYADVLVLVEPRADDWGSVRASGRPTVALVAEEPADDDLLELIEAGAAAVMARGCNSIELVDVVSRLADGHSGLTSVQVRRLVEALHARKRTGSEPPASVTPREREILDAIEAGLTVKDTARRLQISPRTVENTQRLLFRKLGARTRSQAVARALELGVLGARPKREPA